jgi:integrase
MGRERYQEGRVEEVGRRVKKWRGYYYIYQRLPDGKEKRAHKSITLGLRNEMTRREAKDKLRGVIERITHTPSTASPEVTFRWFYEERFLPQKEQIWKAASRPKTKRFIENYLIKRFGDTQLKAFNKFVLQTYLNELAPNFSQSVLNKVRVYFQSILNEALELDFIGKNPALRLVVPTSGKERNERHLDEDEIPALLAALSDRDRLIVRMFLILGLRPGELFALRWNDVEEYRIRVDTSVVDGHEDTTKTTASKSYVWMPASIATELEWWRSNGAPARPDAFIFPSSTGTAIGTNNFLGRVLKAAGEKIGLKGVNHQVLRRTCSTHMAQFASVKDVQAHLRHTTAKTTLDHYIKEVPASVRAAVESLDSLLKRQPKSNQPAN